MPQLTLTLSANINTQNIDWKKFFKQVHECLMTVPDLDVHTAHSGVVQEAFSYIGLDDQKATKVYLKLNWLGNEARTAIQPELGKKLLAIIYSIIVPAIEEQGLTCIPRVAINNLGEINKSYFIGGISFFTNEGKIPSDIEPIAEEKKIPK